MNKVLLFESITKELDSLKDRVRNFIGDVHWLSDGEWKESVLKSVIKRHIPANIGVGSGFIVNETKSTSQIDIILYDLNIPILFRDGDFVIVTPDAVKGIIEVKTSVKYISNFKKNIETLYKNVKFIRDSGNLEYIYTGLFAYDTTILPTKKNIDSMLKILLQHSYGSGNISNINHVSLGENLFIKFWEQDPIGSNQIYYTWHGYELQKKAPAYFIMNTVVEVCDYRFERNSNMLFPPEGKEGFTRGKLKQLQ